MKIYCIIISVVELDYLVTKVALGRINISSISLLKPIGEQPSSSRSTPSLLDVDYPNTSKLAFKH